jgi:hypothetical protein
VPALKSWGNTVTRKIWIILAAVLVIAAAGVFFIRSAEDKVTADVVSRTERFSIPAGWKLEDNVVRGEMFLCLDTNPCPSIYRRWNTGKEITADDLKAVVSKAGVDTKTDGTCSRRSNDIGVATVCSSSGNDGEYDYLINVISPDTNESDLAILTVRPHQ